MPTSSLNGLDGKVWFFFFTATESCLTWNSCLDYKIARLFCFACWQLSRHANRKHQAPGLILQDLAVRVSDVPSPTRSINYLDMKSRTTDRKQSEKICHELFLAPVAHQHSCSGEKVNENQRKEKRKRRRESKRI